MFQSRRAALFFCGLSLTIPALAANQQLLAQSTVKAVFVANNGNLEGSVTAFKVAGDGGLTFLNRVVTGTRASLSDPCPGCNAYEISISPDGKYLATGHPAGDIDGITILQVASDATISQVLQLPFTSSQGIDIVWIDNRYLATIRSDTSPDRVVVYDFNPAVPSLTEVTPNFFLNSNSSSYICRHPSGQYIYVNDSSAAHIIYALKVNAGGVLTLHDTETAGAPFPLEVQVSPDGTKLYSAGGISDGSNKVIGMNIAPDGTLSPMPGMPFISPGNSPSNVFVNGSNSILVAGHGTDATARTFTIDPSTGALTSTGNTFDVGLQGTLGDVHLMDNFLFISDNSTATDGLMGVYSFTVGPTGTLTQNGAILSTQGIAPRGIVSWVPDTDGDMNCDNVVNLDDVDAFALALVDPDAYAIAFPGCDIQRGDVNDDDLFDGLDVGAFSGLMLP